MKFLFFISFLFVCFGYRMWTTSFTPLVCTVQSSLTLSDKDMQLVQSLEVIIATVMHQSLFKNKLCFFVSSLLFRCRYVKFR
jgi:cyanate permease